MNKETTVSPKALLTQVIEESYEKGATDAVEALKEGFIKMGARGDIPEHISPDGYAIIIGILEEFKNKHIKSK